MNKMNSVSKSSLSLSHLKLYSTKSEKMYWNIFNSTSYRVSVSLVLILFTLSSFISPSCGKSQYVEPINMGMKVSIPWDIANIFNRFPIQGVLSAFLALALGGILFFGVITSPFGYMFGIPSEKYVLGDHKQAFINSTAESQSPLFVTWDEEGLGLPRSFLPPLKVPSVDQFTNFLNETLGFETFEESSRSAKSVKKLSDLAWKIANRFYNSKYSPDFLNSLFYLMPKDGNVGTEGCQLLTVCYAHATLKRLPLGFLKIYKVFSRKMMKLPRQYKDSMIIGMEEESRCSEVYANYCTENAFTIALKSYLNFLPASATSNDVPKRKQAMYM